MSSPVGMISNPIFLGKSKIHGNQTTHQTIINHSDLLQNIQILHHCRPFRPSEPARVLHTRLGILGMAPRNGVRGCNGWICQILGNIGWKISHLIFFFGIYIMTYLILPCWFQSRATSCLKYSYRVFCHHGAN